MKELEKMKPILYKGVIFDFNGTLFFDNDKHALAWGQISKDIRGYTISKKELYEVFNGTPNAQNIQYLMNNKATLKDIERYSLLKEDYYRMYCKNDLSSFHLVDGTEDYFEYLKDKHIPMTIASASIKENIDFFVESFHLSKWFDYDTIVYDNGHYINKVQMFKDAAKKIDVNIKDVLVFEDSLSGIKHAYDAGVEKIIVVCKKSEQERFLEYSGVIDTISNFTEYLRRYHREEQ